MNSEEKTELLSKEFLTVREVGDILGLSINTICRMIDNGRLDAINFSAGNKLPRWRVRSSNLKQLLKIEDQPAVREPV